MTNYKKEREKISKIVTKEFSMSLAFRIHRESHDLEIRKTGGSLFDRKRKSLLIFFAANSWESEGTQISQLLRYPGNLNLNFYQNV